ncbi:MAG: tetratricopeptide repeat protein [bacterium]|nr:tetratricopeptide repeat protein [bacterium]
MKKIILIGIIAICMVSAMFAGITSGKGKMSGTVLDKKTGAGIAGVTVKLYFPDQKAYHKPFPKTGKDGKWKVLFIRKGMWNLDFEKDGYMPIKISYAVDSTPGTKNTPVEIKMEATEGPVIAEDVLKKINKGKALMGEKKFANALALFDEVLAKEKDMSGVEIINLYIGNCHSMQGDYAKAIEFYKKSLAKFPTHKGLILSIGNAYNNLKDFDKAMEWFKKLKVDEIDNADTLFNIGAIAYNKGDFKTAADFFKRATIVKPEFAEAYYQLGMTYTTLENNKDALVALRKFMEIGKDSPNFETAKAIVEAYGN